MLESLYGNSCGWKRRPTSPSSRLISEAHSTPGSLRLSALCASRRCVFRCIITLASSCSLPTNRFTGISAYHVKSSPSPSLALRLSPKISVDCFATSCASERPTEAYNVSNAISLMLSYSPHLTSDFALYARRPNRNEALSSNFRSTLESRT